MAEQAKKKDNKNLIVGICVAVVALIVVIVAIVMLGRNNVALNDDYFKSDDTKYVLTVDTDSMDIDTEDEEYVPVKTHVVYTYSGDEITGMKSYAEYADAATAEKAFKQLKESDEEEAKTAELNGKYIVITNDASDYEGLTASDIKERIELMEMLQNMGSDIDEDEDEDEVEIEDEEDEDEE